MTPKEKGSLIVRQLKDQYPDSCSLEADEPYRLLFATRLAAQCTDARVNLVTPILYGKYPTLEALAEAPLEDLTNIVKPCGFYHTKARDIKLASQMLLTEYGGIVPDSMEALLRLPGIGRKTANLILSDVYGHPAIVADTHCIRIAGRLGLHDCDNNPHKVELALAQIIEPAEQSALCHRFVHFGRDICTARKPQCQRCALTYLCTYYQSATK